MRIRSWGGGIKGERGMRNEGDGEGETKGMGKGKGSQGKKRMEEVGRRTREEA